MKIFVPIDEDQGSVCVIKHMYLNDCGTIHRFSAVSNEIRDDIYF